MLRVVFFGNSASIFSNRFFQELTRTPCELAGVVDVPPAKRSSTNTRTLNGIPSFVLAAHSRRIAAFEPASPNTPEFIQLLARLTPDLFIAVGYMNLLKEQLLAVPGRLAVNVHASLLPAYRGKHPVFWALRNGERWAGLTIHVMASGLDTGDILYQVRVRTRRNDSVSSLYERIMDRSVGLMSQLIEDVAGQDLHRTPQPTIGSSYYSSTHDEDYRLDWSRDAEQLRRWIQTSPGQCFCDAAGQRIFFSEAKMVPVGGEIPPGVLLRIGRANCTVAARNAGLQVSKLSLGGESERPAASLCRELGLREGSSLA
jgi:methionyl-tRNA formyltransferase